MEARNNCRENNSQGKKYEVGFHHQPRSSRHIFLGQRADSAGAPGKGPRTGSHGRKGPSAIAWISQEDGAEAEGGQGDISSLQYMSAYHEPGAGG